MPAAKVKCLLAGCDETVSENKMGHHLLSKKHREELRGRFTASASAYLARTKKVPYFNAIGGGYNYLCFGCKSLYKKEPEGHLDLCKNKTHHAEQFKAFIEVPKKGAIETTEIVEATPEMVKEIADLKKQVERLTLKVHGQNRLLDSVTDDNEAMEVIIKKVFGPKDSFDTIPAANAWIDKWNDFGKFQTLCELLGDPMDW